MSFAAFMNLRKYLIGILHNGPNLPFAVTKVKLILDFFNYGLIVWSELDTVFRTRDHAAIYIRQIKEILRVITKDMMHIINPAEFKSSDHKEPPELPVLQDGITEAEKRIMSELIYFTVELDELDYSNRSIAGIIAIIISQGTHHINNHEYATYGILILICQLSICDAITDKLGNKEYCESANRYLFSIGINPEGAKKIYSSKPHDFPVISKCMFQLIGDPEFDLYNFFIKGPIALFYNNIDMMNEIEFVLTEYSDLNLKFSNLDKLGCKFYRGLIGGYRKRSYRSRIDRILEINGISKKLSNNKKYIALLEKFGNNIKYPVVTFTRQI